MKKIKLLIAIMTLFLLAKINYGQSFTLGTAANFVLFTSTGAVANTGSSNFIGNIGSDVGAISGFGTSTLTGTIYNSDAVTAQAKTDLFIAYNQLMSIPATVTTHAPAFGGGETLTTGVYTIAGAGSLGGNITLDGLGDPSAVFIFRFGGAYAVGAISTVILTNGARSCNIFWVAEGAISMGATTTMKGTLIANNAAVSMAVSGNLDGRMLSTTGAISFGPGTASIPTCTASITIPTSPPCCNPNFGSTINFVLFSNNGAVTNTGPSYLNINVGADAGSITGFGTATVTGSIYFADAATASAKIDLYNLYNQLMITPTTNGTHPLAFGGGETLHTGVYYIGSAASLGGTLILDALGDTNAVFIFKMRGAFVVAPSTTIVLLNSASPCSVFWVAEGSISIGASSILKGTFIANNAAVSMATNGDLRGRLFSTNGAIAFDESVATNADPCHQPTYTLPIELIAFKGECNNQNIILNWSTATETNNDFYSIERSLDGINWQFVAKVEGAGNSISLNNYSFIDVEPYNGISYYRLKQTDFNEKFKYSNIIDIEKCGKDVDEIDIFPNPANKIINLSFKGGKQKIISISIYNVLGEIVFYSEELQSKIVLEDNSTGIYFVHVSLTSKKIIKKLLIGH
jgi:hypothetical protein